MADKKIIDFEVEDHGVEGSQYFQGAGLAYTDFDDIATGAGNNAAEAFDDALEQLAQNDWDVSELEKEKKDYEDGKEIMMRVSFQTEWDQETDEEGYVITKNVKSSLDAEIEYMKSPKEYFEKDIQDGEAYFTFYGSADEGAQEILDFCRDEGIPINQKTEKELEKLSKYGVNMDSYYYLSIRVKGDEEEEPEESKRKARKVANLVEKLMK